MKLSELKENPNNPRFVKDGAFAGLVKSLTEFPEMMELRPIVIDADNIILGGNMRFKALLEMGRDEIPDSWVVRAEQLTEDQKKRFIIADNKPFGEWDFEKLANEWDMKDLLDWGFDDLGVVDEPDSPRADGAGEGVCAECGRKYAGRRVQALERPAA